MKFILNEEETLKEETSLQAFDRNSGNLDSSGNYRYGNSKQQSDQSQQQDSNDQQKDQKSEEKDAKTGALKDPGNRLLNVIKAVSKQGYEAFMNGIKGNINNPEFPFVKLMNQPEFSNALGLGKIFEELNEDTLVNHSINGMGAGERTVNKFRAKVNDVKNKMGDKTLGKLINNIKGRADPMTFTKFGTVYNAFVSNDVPLDYLETENGAIVYDPNLYRLKDMKDIERAIEVDVKAFKDGETKANGPVRSNVKKAVSYNRVKRLDNSTGQDNTEQDQRNTTNSKGQKTNSTQNQQNDVNSKELETKIGILRKEYESLPEEEQKAMLNTLLRKFNIVKYTTGGPNAVTTDFGSWDKK